MRKFREFPHDGKRREPKVGIIYFVEGKLLIDSTPLAQAGSYAGIAIHELDHITYWSELVKTGQVPNSEYEGYPRGRVCQLLMAHSACSRTDAS